MALELKYKITANGTESLFIEDETGVYDLNNLTGWGSPNFERADYALVLYIKYNHYNKPSENLSLVNDVIRYTTLNTDVSTFQIDYLKDGWYSFAMLAVPTTIVAPVEDNIIFDTGAGKLQVYKSGAFIDLVSTDWELLLDDTKYTLTKKEEIFFLDIVCKRNELLEELINCYQCTSCKCQDKENELLRLNIFIQGTDYRFHSQKEYEAQRMIEILSKQFKC